MTTADVSLVAKESIVVEKLKNYMPAQFFCPILYIPTKKHITHSITASASSAYIVKHRGLKGRGQISRNERCSNRCMGVYIRNFCAIIFRTKLC